VAPSEDVLREQIDGAKREVETDLAELRTQLSDLLRKVVIAVGILVTVLIAFKVGRRIWRRSPD
jgi:hypothetical protein